MDAHTKRYRGAEHVALCLTAFALLSSCHSREVASDRWLGYAEADEIYVAAPKAGWITKLNVHRGSRVRPGDTLFLLDDNSQAAGRSQAEAAIAQAEQQLQSARASETLAQKEYRRQKALLKTEGTTRQNFDEARSSLATATAARKKAAAALAEDRAAFSDAAYQLSQREIRARSGGIVQDIFFRPGEYASAATPVVEILPPNTVYARFFVPESAYSQLKLGQKVEIHCDGCKPLSATISFIAASYEYAPPVVFSVRSRTKLVYKVEARTEGGVPLHPGQPIDVSPAGGKA